MGAACGIGLDQDVATILGILSLIGALWCFVDLSRAIDAKHPEPPDDARPGPNERRH